MNPYKYPSEQKLCPLWPIYEPILWNLVQRAKTAVWNYESSKTSSGAMERTVPVFVKQEYWCLLHEVYQPCNLSCCTDCAKQLFFHTSILLSKWGISCCQPHSLRLVQMLEAISMENVCIDQFCLHNHCSIVHLKVKLHKYQSTSLERQVVTLNGELLVISMEEDTINWLWRKNEWTASATGCTKLWRSW